MPKATRSSPTSRPRLEIAMETTANGITHLVLDGELDLSMVPEVESGLAGRIGECLVVDMAGLTFIDSSGLRLILQLQDAAARDGWALRLVPGPAEVQRVFQLVDLEQRLPFIGPAGSNGYR